MALFRLWPAIYSLSKNFTTLLLLYAQNLESCYKKYSLNHKFSTVLRNVILSRSVSGKLTANRFQYR